MIPDGWGDDRRRARITLGKKPLLTCNDCYFRRAALCALPGPEPCPTFRLDVKGRAQPPRQPVLVPRPPAELAPGLVRA
jgi:hypothetical protein